MYVIAPVLDDQQAVSAVGYHALHRHDPGLAAAIAVLPPVRLRRLAQLVAVEAVAAAGLGDHPVVNATVAALKQPVTGPTAELEAFVRQVTADAARTKDYGPWKTLGPGVAAYRDVGPETRKGWKRRGAAGALRAAMHPDPLTAALDAVNSARFAFPDDHAEFLDRVRRELA